MNDAAPSIGGVLERRLGAVLRPVIGGLQGLALWYVADAHLPLLKDPGVHAGAWLLALVVPLILLVGLGRMRRATLATWVGVAALLAIGLGTYAGWREFIEPVSTGNRSPEYAALYFFGGAAFYILHHLLEPADRTRRWRAPYVAYVDDAWRHAFQLPLSLLFAGVFIGILHLAAALFAAIGIDALRRLLDLHVVTATLGGIAFGAAVGRTDAHPALLDGVRRIVFALFSWLLPVVVGLVALFLALLVTTGLDPLWKTSHAAELLLSTAALIVVLVNAAYQDGRDPDATPKVVRWSARGAGVVLPILVALATFALALRIRQLGLTTARAAGVATCVLAAVYAVGYAIAALRRGPWMRTLESVNVLAAITAVVLVVALFSPIADPARLATADQVRRLNDGTVPADRFDFDALRFRLARFGVEALDVLARSSDRAIASRAQAARKMTRPSETGGTSAGEALSHAHVRPEGAALPPGFREQRWESPIGLGASACLVSAAPCDLFVMDLDGDGRADVLAVGAPDKYPLAVAFVRASDGTWRDAGFYAAPTDEVARDALKAGAIETVEPLVRDLRIAGKRFRVVPGPDFEATRPPTAPGANPK